MTCKLVSYLVLFLLCLSQCTSQYYLNSQYYNNGRRLWSYYEKSTTESSSPNRVNITLYYETLCPASVQYLKDVLRPVVEKLGPHLDVHLVPYGHAQTRYVNRRYRFNCQHGHQECFLNRIHACAIDVIQNSTKSTLFNACLMEHTQFKEDIGYDYQSALTTCAEKLNVSSMDIWRCLNTRRGMLLQKRFGEETHRLSHLQYVPYVLIDGIEDVRNENLINVICRKLYPTPSVCPQRMMNQVNSYANR